MSTRDAELESRSTALSELISANEELSRSRVVLEMKCVELEEQRDRWVQEEREIKQRMEEMRKELKVWSLVLEFHKNKLRVYKILHQKYGCES